MAAEKQMFGAYNESEALQLLNQSGIDYVFVGPSELYSSQYYVNERFLAGRFGCVFNWTDPQYNNTYKIYKV